MTATIAAHNVTYQGNGTCDEENPDLVGIRRDDGVENDATDEADIYRMTERNLRNPVSDRTDRGPLKCFSIMIIRPRGIQAVALTPRLFSCVDPVSRL
jgi:hypothetical protein